VATAVGGIPEMVSDGETALLTAAGDPHALAGVLARVLTDKAEAARIGAAGLEASRTRFSVPSHYRSLLPVYERLTAGGA